LLGITTTTILIIIIIITTITIIIITITILIIITLITTIITITIMIKVRDPIQRAVSSYDHSIKCGKHCAMCWKMISDPLRWARQCSDVQNAQVELTKGTLEDVEQVVEDYDLVLVTERYFESLVVLRHILGVALVEVLFLSHEGEPQDGEPVSLAGRPGRFLDILSQRNTNDRKFHAAANVRSLGIHGSAVLLFLFLFLCTLLTRLSFFDVLDCT
jgi:hypothetical protein